MASIRVYNGDGAGSRSVLSAVETIQRAVVSEVKVSQIGPEELLAGSWQHTCLALVMPGGADLPYCRRLNGTGNRLIRGYVEEGGAYIGLCAGAYYASSYIEFDIGTKLEVKGRRELAFFEGKAVGPVYAGFCYESEAGAQAAPIAFSPPPDKTRHSSATDPAVKWQERSPGALHGVGMDTRHWIQCRDYSNGGPSFEPFTDSSASMHREFSTQTEAFQVLAVYTEKNDAIAALKCSIGRGVALLVGTHPELDPKWLASQRDTVAVDQGLKDQNGLKTHDEGVREHVKEQLERCDAERRLYIDMLLSEAGLGKYLRY
ncbi:g11 [Coccomyxa viridis]|uniref:G11 protein n=1 Tax=Coccomyxa viridis TaxID=1274662 RepID=A0ABP1FEN3_9CHLO